MCMSSLSFGRNFWRLKCLTVIFASMFTSEMNAAGALIKLTGKEGKSQSRKMLVKEFLENLSVFKSADR